MTALLRITFGLFIVLLGVFIVRRPDISMPAMPVDLRPYLTQLRGIKAFSYLPPTILPALFLACLGSLLLLPTRRPRGDETPQPLLIDFAIRTRHLVWLGVLMVIVLMGCIALEHYRILGRPWVSLAVAGALLLSALHAWLEDRRSHIRPRIPLGGLELVILVAASAGLLCFYVQHLDSWRFSYIGDEYGFFWYAEGLINRTLKDASLLEASGCFKFFPMFTSWWQTWFMRAFGPTNVAWRSSMAAITALSVPACYVLLKVMFAKLGNRAWLGAAAGTAVLYLCEFTTVWARLGKPHAVFLPPVVFAAAFTMLAISQGSRTFLVLAGLSAGLGIFLSSLGPVIALGTAGIMLLTWRCPLSTQYKCRRWSACIAPGLIVLITFTLAAAPVLVQVDYWQNMLFVNLASPEAKSNFHLFYPKLVSSLFLPLDFITAAHFLSGNVVDPIAAALFIIGVFGARAVGWQPILIGIAIHGMVAYVVGAKSQYAYPPPTRMQLDMFPVAIMAGIGFSVVASRIRAGAPFVVMAFILWSGAYTWVKLQDYNPYQFKIHVNSGFLKALQEAPRPDKHFVLVLPKGVYRNFFDHYNKTFEPKFSLGYIDSSANVREFIEAASRQNPNGVVVLLPDSETELLPSIESLPPESIEITEVPMRLVARRNTSFDSALTPRILPIIQLFEGMGRAT